jgi:hypothetical protein
MDARRAPDQLLGSPRAAGIAVLGESQTREHDYPQIEEYSSNSG